MHCYFTISSDHPFWFGFESYSFQIFKFQVLGFAKINSRFTSFYDKFSCKCCNVDILQQLQVWVWEWNFFYIYQHKLKRPSTSHVLHSFAFIVTVNIVTAFMIPMLAQVTEVH